jgi:hypothetical protein
LQRLFDATADLCFVLVAVSGVDVSVSHRDSMADGPLNLSRL